LNGKIVRLVRERGFGFIRVDGGKEVFFHSTAVQDGVFESMSEGGSVDFDLGKDANSSRDRAINVRVAAQ
jgi:cold shock protein